MSSKAHSPGATPGPGVAAGVAIAPTDDLAGPPVRSRQNSIATPRDVPSIGSRPSAPVAQAVPVAIATPSKRHSLFHHQNQLSEQQQHSHSQSRSQPPALQLQQHLSSGNSGSNGIPPSHIRQASTASAGSEASLAPSSTTGSLVNRRSSSFAAVGSSLSAAALAGGYSLEGSAGAPARAALEAQAQKALAQPNGLAQLRSTALQLDVNPNRMARRAAAAAAQGNSIGSHSGSSGGINSGNSSGSPGRHQRGATMTSLSGMLAGAATVQAPPGPPPPSTPSARRSSGMLSPGGGPSGSVPGPSAAHTRPTHTRSASELNFDHPGGFAGAGAGVAASPQQQAALTAVATLQHLGSDMLSFAQLYAEPEPVVHQMENGLKTVKNISAFADRWNKLLEQQQAEQTKLLLMERRALLQSRQADGMHPCLDAWIQCLDEASTGLGQAQADVAQTFRERVLPALERPLNSRAMQETVAQGLVQYQTLERETAKHLTARHAEALKLLAKLSEKRGRVRAKEHQQQKQEAQAQAARREPGVDKDLEALLNGSHGLSGAAASGGSDAMLIEGEDGSVIQISSQGLERLRAKALKVCQAYHDEVQRSNATLRDKRRINIARLKQLQNLEEARMLAQAQALQEFGAAHLRMAQYHQQLGLHMQRLGKLAEVSAAANICGFVQDLLMRRGTMQSAVSAPQDASQVAAPEDVVSAALSSGVTVPSSTTVLAEGDRFNYDLGWHPSQLTRAAFYRKPGLFFNRLEDVVSYENHQLSVAANSAGLAETVPRVLTALTQAVEANGGFRTQGILRISPSFDQLAELKAQLEAFNFAIPSGLNPHVPAELLKCWLRSLPEPLVPYSSYNLAIGVGRLHAQAMTLLASADGHGYSSNNNGRNSRSASISISMSSIREDGPADSSSDAIPGGPPPPSQGKPKPRPPAEAFPGEQEQLLGNKLPSVESQPQLMASEPIPMATAPMESPEPSPKAALPPPVAIAAPAAAAAGGASASVEAATSPIPMPLPTPAGSHAQRSLKELLQQVPQLNRLVMLHLVRFVHQLLAREHVAATKMTLHNLSVVFAPCLVRVSPTDERRLDPELLIADSQDAVSFVESLCTYSHLLHT